MIGNAKHALRIVEWTEEEDKRLFELYKDKGSCWSSIATEFAGRTENQVKNRFYSTLRRLATKHSSLAGQVDGDQVPKTKKKDLLKFVDDAILYGHNCRSKRGRKRKLSKDGEKGGSDENDKKNGDSSSVLVDSPDYVKLLIAHNSKALKLFDEKVVKDGNGSVDKLDELIALEKEIEERLKSTQDVISRKSADKKDISLDSN